MMKSEKGFSLAEVMVAIALLGVVSVSLLSAIGTAYKAVFLADEQASAESLARSEMEYVKSQEYGSAPWDYTVTSSQRTYEDRPTWWSDEVDNEKPPFLPEEYDGYTVIVDVKILDGHTIDDGIQKITVVVKRGDKEVVILESYRSMRL